MKTFFVKSMFLIFFSLFLSGTGFSAQSTVDVPASPELKRSARSEILARQADVPEDPEEYIVGHGDILSVSIYGEGDMAASSAGSAARPGTEAGAQRPDAPRPATFGVVVMMDGRISLRYIGDVEVVGLTLTQVADYLKKLYVTVFDDPIVTVTLVQSNSLRYTIIGNVLQPGIFYLDYPMTIVQTIARSGGFTEWANNEITVIRQELRKGDEQLFKGNSLDFDYDDFVSGKDLEKNIIIRSGDTIIAH